ncbi:MAG: hypothetical protein PGN09_08535 [Sphingomonas fennica]
MAKCRRPALAAAAGGLAIVALGGASEPRDVGGWTLATSEDGRGCFLSRQYPRAGETTLLLGLEADGSNHLSILNANWSIRAKERVRLDFRMTTATWRRHFAIGLAADGKRGFVTSFEPRFLTAFAGSERLAVDRGDTPVERLPLDGSAAAVRELRTCVGTLKTPPRGTRENGIPKDPFAAGGAGRR